MLLFIGRLFSCLCVCVFVTCCLLCVFKCLVLFVVYVFKCLVCGWLV